MERQTAEEIACGDFVLNGSDTPYGMMNFTYEPEEFERLVALSRYNVLNNAETMRHALRLALEQQQARDRARGQPGWSRRTVREGSHRGLQTRA